MPLSCDYDCIDDEYYADPDDDFSKAKTDCRCVSCGKKIKVGDTVLHFTCYRGADPYSENPEDIEAEENGDWVWLPDEYHCERCGEIYLNLQAVGYCLYSGDNMPSLLREYQEMVGFEPEKYHSGMEK